MEQLTLQIEDILPHIFLIRESKIMLDFQLALLYGVETRVLLQAVSRNNDRFPEDFMFRLTDEEYQNLTSQFVMSSGHGGRRRPPYAFTEQGVAMLSSVLRSEKAISVNIALMRAFVKMRQLLDSNRELSIQLKELEAKYDHQFKVVFDALHQLIETKQTPRTPIGFPTQQNED